MSKPRASSATQVRRTAAKVRLKPIKKGEPAFFRWLGAIEVGPGSVEEDIRAARELRGKGPRHR